MTRLDRNTEKILSETRCYAEDLSLPVEEYVIHSWIDFENRPVHGEVILQNCRNIQINLGMLDKSILISNKRKDTPLDVGTFSSIYELFYLSIVDPTEVWRHEFIYLLDLLEILS